MLFAPYGEQMLGVVNRNSLKLAKSMDALPWRDTTLPVGSGVSTPVNEEDNGVTSLFVRTLTKSPPVFYTEDLLTPEECAHIIEVAAPFLGRGAGHRNTGVGTIPEATLRRDPVFKRLPARIAALNGLDVDIIRAGMEVQVINYKPNGYISVHHDSSSVYGKLTTTFVYLNEGFEGGQTAFPLVTVDGDAEAPPEQLLRAAHVSCNGSDEVAARPVPGFDDLADLRRWTLYHSVRDSVFAHCDDPDAPGMVVQPKLGAAVLWYNHQRGSGMVDNNMDHTGCLVSNGEKWGLNWWVTITPAVERLLRERRQQGGDSEL